MAIQKTVGFEQAFGVVGEIILDGPSRVSPGVLKSTDQANNIVGRYFTCDTDGNYQAGGEGMLGGLLVNPKVYVSQGASTGALDPTLQLNNGVIGEFIKMGYIIVQTTNAAIVGNDVHYVIATGELLAAASGSTPETGNAVVPNAKFNDVAQPSVSGGIALVRITN